MGCITKTSLPTGFHLGLDNEKQPETGGCEKRLGYLCFCSLPASVPFTLPPGSHPCQAALPLAGLQ